MGFVFLRARAQSKLTTNKNLNPDAEHASLVHGIWVWVLDLEHCRAGAHAVEAFLLVESLFARAGKDRGEEWSGVGYGAGDGCSFERSREAREEGLAGGRCGLVDE
jgi:hypothetical protein